MHALLVARDVRLHCFVNSGDVYPRAPRQHFGQMKHTRAVPLSNLPQFRPRGSTGQPWHSACSAGLVGRSRRRRRDANRARGYQSFQVDLTLRTRHCQCVRATLMGAPLECERWRRVGGHASGASICSESNARFGADAISFPPAYYRDCGWKGIKWWLQFVDCTPHAGDSEFIGPESTETPGAKAGTLMQCSFHCFDSDRCR
jgi:hypothetical protein